jgi:hypothetical protein
MSRDTLLDLLARAVQEQFVTEDEARTLLRRYDAGELDLSDEDAPLDLADAIRPVTDEDVERVLVSLLALGTLTYLHLRRAAVRETLQDRFIERAKGLAKAKATGNLTLPAWQQSMGDEIRSHIVQQVAVGSGRIPAANALTEAVNAQEAYLSRWADELTIKTAVGDPTSELGMMARAALYAGAGRAEGYKAEAELYPEGGVVTYAAVDDDGTCQPCLDAEGTYSVSESFPTPGAVCLGSGNCRCTLEFSEVAA